MTRLIPWLTLAGLIACGGATGLDGETSRNTGATEQATEDGETISQEEAGLLEQIESEDPVTRKRALARLGLLYESEERWAESAAMLERAVDAYDELRPFLQLHLIDVLVRLEEWDEAIRVSREIAAEASGTVAATTAAIRLPALLARSGDTEAAAEAAAFLVDLPIDELTEAEHVASADILAEEKLLDEASTIRERLIRSYTRGRYTEKLYDQLTALPESPLDRLSWDNSIALASQLESANRHEETREYLARIRNRFPRRANDPEIVWIEAQSLFDSRRYSDLQKLSIPTGKARHVGLERLKGHGLWRIDRNQEFLSAMSHILDDHGDTSEAMRVKLLLGKYWLINGNDSDKAARYLDEAIRAGGVGSDGENLWTLAWIYVTSNQRSKALAMMNDYLARFPDSSYTTNSLFWSAKIHEREGKLEKRNELLDRLIRTYPYAYYSYRAREILERPLTAPDEIAGGRQFPEIDPEDLLERNPKLSIVRELEAIGLTGEATREYKEIVGANPEDPMLAYGLADRYASGGEPLRAIILLNRHFSHFIRRGGSNIPDRFWKILYPREYWDAIRAAAEERKIDPYLMAAIIRQESGWDPSIVSSAGAVGLMQIMPEEAASFGTLAGLERTVTRRDLFDPMINIRVGAAEIREKLEAMDDDQLLAIAAYNAGESAVNGWIGRISAEDRDLFIDSIPYGETRLYVMTVTRNLHEYRRVYGATDRWREIEN